MNFIISLGLSEYPGGELALNFCFCVICVQLRRVFRGNFFFIICLSFYLFSCLFLFFLSIVYFPLFGFALCYLFVCLCVV